VPPSCAQFTNEWDSVTSSRVVRHQPVRQKRFYDFKVWSERKRIEKLGSMHRNRVKRGLAESPEQWKWSSFRAYFYGEPGLVRANFQEWPLQLKPLPVQKFGGDR
jgi:hypothetical protein